MTRLWALLRLFAMMTLATAFALAPAGVPAASADDEEKAEKKGELIASHLSAGSFTVASYTAGEGRVRVVIHDAGRIVERIVPLPADPPQREGRPAIGMTMRQATLSGAGFFGTLEITCGEHILVTVHRAKDGTLTVSGDAIEDALKELEKAAEPDVMGKVGDLDALAKAVDEFAKTYRKRPVPQKQLDAALEEARRALGRIRAFADARRPDATPDEAKVIAAEIERVVALEAILAELAKLPRESEGR